MNDIGSPPIQVGAAVLEGIIYAKMVTTEQRNKRKHTQYLQGLQAYVTWNETGNTGYRQDTTTPRSSCELGDEVDLEGATGSIATPKTTSGTPASSSPSSPHPSPSSPRIFPLPPGLRWCSSSSTAGGTYADRCGFGIAIMTATRTSAARWTGSSCSSGMVGASSVPAVVAVAGVELGGVARARVRRLRGKRCAAPSSTARMRG